MRTTKRRKKLLLALLLLAAVGLAVYVNNIRRQAMNRVPDAIRKVASERINGTVTIGKIEVFNSHVILSDSVISIKNKPVVRIPRMNIRYSLIAAAMKRTEPVSSIRRIDIFEPSVYLERSADGEWNIADLLKPPPPRQPMKLRAPIYVKSCRATIRDSWKHSTPMVNIFRKVDISADLSGMPAIKYSASGKGQTGRLGKFTVKGLYDFDSHALYANLEMLDASAAYWSAYPWNTGLKVLSGKARVAIELSKAGQDKPIKYLSTIKLRSVSVRFKQLRIPVRDINGNLDVRNGLVSMRLKGRLASSPFLISGHVIRHQATRLSLKLTSDRANFREIAGLTAVAKHLNGTVLPTSGRFNGLIFGPPRSPGVGFTLEAPSLSYSNFTMRSIAAKGTYFDGLIDIQKATAKAYGGLIEVGGEIRIAEPLSAALDGRVLGLKLDQVPSLKKQQLAASTTGNFQASWMPGKGRVRYRGTLGNGRFHGLPFVDGEIAATYRGGTLHIRELSAKMLGGHVAVSGEIKSDRTLSLHIAGSDINLASVRDMYWKAPTVGRGQFAGEITGSVDAPIFKGEIEVYRTMVSGIEIERVAASITASRKAISLNDVVIYDYPGTISLSGTINNPLSKLPTFDLSIEADSLDMDRLSRASGSTAWTGGKLSGRLTVSGNLNLPTVEGSLRMEGGVYRDIEIDVLEARAAYRGNRLQIDRFSAQTGNSLLTASGWMSDERIAVKFDGSQLALEKFSGLLKPYAFASGNAEVSGSISGMIDSPRAELSVKCDNPIINNQKITSLTGKALWENNSLVLSELNLVDADTRYTIPELSYNADSKTITLSMRAQNGDAGKLLALLDGSPITRQTTDGSQTHLRRILDRLPKPFTGTVNGSISGNIQLTDEKTLPDLNVEATITNIISGTSSIETVHLEGSWKNDVVRLEKLEARDHDTNIFAEASFGPLDTLSAQVDAHNLSMDTLRQWVKLPRNFSGRADVTIVASGSSLAPVAEMYIETVDPVIGGTKFDRLRCRLSTNGSISETADISKAEAQGRINIDYITLTLGDHDLRASGYLPVDWRDFTIPSDGPILLQSNIDKDSLAILSAFSGITAETGQTGAFEGSIRLEGTAETPKLEGDLTWRDGQVRFPRINTLFEKIDAHILLGENGISIEKLAGVSAEGGQFDISGRITLANMKPSLDLVFKTSGLRISGRNITDTYEEEVRAVFDSDLKATGDWRSPLMSGTIDIPEGLIVLPGRIRKPQETRGPLPINPEFNVKASLGRGAELRMPRLKTPLYGELAVSGSLSKPIVEGAVDITDGVIMFPMREFKFMPGSRMELHVGSSQRSAVFLDIRAEARLTSVSILGQRKRYTIVMIAQGPLDNLKPTFSSSPPGLSEQTIVALVTGQRQLQQILSRDGGGDMGKELSGLFSTAMMPSMLEPIEKVFESIGFEEFALEMGYREPLQLTIGESLGNKLYLDYTTILGARPDYADSLYELQLSYQLRPSLELNMQTDENHIFSIGIGGRIRF